MLERRGGHPVGERAVVGQEQEALAVVVEPADGIDARHVDEVLQAGMAGLVGELAEDSVGLVEDQVAHGYPVYTVGGA
ncbi:hypothetical protein D3C87_2112960 [compost metagenome]